MNALLIPLLLLLQSAPEESHKRLSVADDLEVRLFAKEPQLFNPACFDVDEKGRVWVIEGVNYRGSAGPKTAQPPYFLTPLRKTGDRIVILEDTDGDGACDKSTVFYEGLDLQAPMGIALIGDKVWISQAPTMFTIEIRPDGTAGKKETVLAGFNGLNGDHAVHSPYVGADGRLYHCIGDSGGNLRFPDGRRLANDGRPWIGGIIARTNLDLTGLEVLGHNHRNQVECATDSFGNTFTSDNDHDGREWVRFHYVMEGGDFGWMGPKGSHWRMEYPGIVPILMRTGAGSPAGMCIYEGTLLPAQYRGAALHADAVGRIHGFRLSPDGAAWRVAGAAVDANGRQTIETLSEIRKPDILLGSADRWFRPSDVAVAPDGSVFVSDWYDPVVGGGGMGDPWTGRIYRIVPKGHDGRYRAPAADDVVAQLGSPCVAARTKAILKLRAMGPDAKSLLASHARSKDRVLRARVLWMLGADAAAEALKDPDPDFRVLAIRILKRDGADLHKLALPLIQDPSAHVRRELLLSVRHPEFLLPLARAYDGHDRWYLEAVGIAFRGREAELVPPLTDGFKMKWDARLPKLLWVMKRPEAVPSAAFVAADATRSIETRLEALDALASFHQREAGDAVVRVLATSGVLELEKRAIQALTRNVPVSWKTLSDSAELRAALERFLASDAIKADAHRLLTALGTRPLVKWRLSPAMPDPDCAAFLAPHAPETAAEPEKLEGWKDARVSMEGQIDLRPQCMPRENATAYLVTVLHSKEAFETRLLVGSDDAINVFVNGRRVWDKHEHRELASRADTIPIRLAEGINRILVKTENRTGNWAYVMEIEDTGRRITEVTPAGGPRPPAPPSERLDPKKLPPFVELLKAPGDAGRGRDVFFRSKAECAKCHKVKGEGGDIGPELSVIGTKFGREGFLISILRPHEAVSPEYTQWIVKSASKGVVTGFVVEETGERLALKDGEGKRIEIAKSDIEDRKKSDLSPMPDTLVGELTRQDLADLLDYLGTLR